MAPPEPDVPPPGMLALRTIAMPADANANGDIFGGWVLAQMDLAGSVVAARRAASRIATVAVEGMTFHKPINIGDLVTGYATVAKAGRTSITIHVVIMASRRATQEEVRVTEGTFVYVAIDDDGKPRPLPPA